MTKELPKEISAKTTYKVIKEDLTAYLAELQALYNAYIASGEVTEEDISEVVPQLYQEWTLTKGAVEKLNQDEIYNWFIENMTKEIDDKVTDQDIQDIIKGLDTLARVESILTKGAEDLMDVILPFDPAKRVLN